MAQNGSGQTDWKDKYLTALEDQEKRERSQQQLTSLLMRAVIRISLVADGIDQRLDKQLEGLRRILRENNPSRRDLNTVVDALEGQVKRLDDVKKERAEVIAQSFNSLVKQLQNLGPERDTKHLLKQLNKTLKQRSGKIEQYASLVKELAFAQQSILQEGGGLRISKPFWHRWADSAAPAPGEQEAAAAADNKNKSVGEKAVVAEITESKGLPQKESVRDGGRDEADGLDLSNDKSAPAEAIDPTTVGEEPPFSRLNKAVCEILSELLQQIECPAMAEANYNSAKKQLEKGLNWYELVPTLEDISIVVISAFDSNQKEFEKFLSQLNSRLSDAYEFIHASQAVHDEGAGANRELRDSMQEQVSAMQESVASASDLQQLKHTVTQRLDQIVAAMDKHSSGEKQREISLAEQLDALVERVKTMEASSADAEKRIEEQRQKALRDVLTQLPNREAYQQRLEQEYDRWQRYQRPLTLVVCDVDHFKRVNDTYGHLAGDKVLRIIAKTLQKRLRKTDFIARYGGEEFVVLMPETPEQAALKVVNGVREAVANCPFHFKEQPVTITTSFGVSGFVEGDNADTVFARADRALYQAKEQGRNRCVLAESPPSEAV